MTSHRRALVLMTAILIWGNWLADSEAQSSSEPAPHFTAEQSVSGRTAYRQHCASCHGAKLEGADIAPSLAGERFDRTWRGKTVDVFLFHVRRMPPEPVATSESLDDETYADILAYILRSNGLEAGDSALPSNTDELASMTIPRGEGGDYDPDAPVPGAAERSEQLQQSPAVTDSTLRDPSPDDWLQWGRTYDGHNFSPLDQINRDNVQNLRPAWRAPLHFGTSMPTPLVHHGIMYLHTFPDTVLALDASSGDVLWRYQHESNAIPSQKMGMALRGEKLLVPTSDLHVVALNAKSGDLIWNHEIVPETPPQMRNRYQLRSAPLVVGNKVIQGVTASFVAKGAFILVLDIDSGDELWRFNTIARPGDPGGDSWNGLELDKRSGGSFWHQGTYDPESNLIYIGVAPTYDTGPLVHPAKNDEVTSEALYTNCTIALDADTGELVWHYQHMANDQWDLDWVFERQIINLPVNGVPRKTVINVGKMAILEALDAATGRYLFSIDAGVQNVITAIDPETGAKLIDPNKWPDPDRPCVICPSAFGARSWPSTSFSPETGLVYVPITEWCMGMGPEGFRLLTSGVGLTSEPHPDTADGMMGRVVAYDLENGRIAWTRDQATPPTTSVLATGGGIIFSGDIDPSLKAFDDTTGELLWSTALDDMPSSNLVTYAIGEKQHVAVIVGFTNNHVRDLTRSFHEFSASAGLETFDPPKGGAAIWTFAL